MLAPTTMICVTCHASPWTRTVSPFSPWMAQIADAHHRNGDGLHQADDGSPGRTPSSRRAIRPPWTSLRWFAGGWSPQANPVRSIHPSIIWTLAQSFGAAKLDLGEELPAVVEHVIEQVGAANAGDDDPAAMLGFVADLVKQVDGDAFALFSCLNETSVGVPDEGRAAMGMALLFSGEAAAAEASIGWLLDPATVVRRAAATALGDAARKGKVTPTMLRRMITTRNWLPDPALDAAVATARRKGAAGAMG
jgi:hypothetical protein